MSEIFDSILKGKDKCLFYGLFETIDGEIDRNEAALLAARDLALMTARIASSRPEMRNIEFNLTPESLPAVLNAIAGDPAWVEVTGGQEPCYHLFLPVFHDNGGQSPGALVCRTYDDGTAEVLHSPKGEWLASPPLAYTFSLLRSDKAERDILIAASENAGVPPGMVRSDALIRTLGDNEEMIGLLAATRDFMIPRICLPNGKGHGSEAILLEPSTECCLTWIVYENRTYVFRTDVPGYENAIARIKDTEEAAAAARFLCDRSPRGLGSLLAPLSERALMCADPPYKDTVILTRDGNGPSDLELKRGVRMLKNLREDPDLAEIVCRGIRNGQMTGTDIE